MDPLASFAFFAMLMLVIFSFLNGPRAIDGSRPLISSYYVFLILFSIYVVFSSSLSILFNDAEFTWAKSVSDPTYILVTVVVCMYALIVFQFGYWFVWRARVKLRVIADSPVMPYQSVHIAFGLVILGVLLKAYVIVQLGGFSESLLRLSGGIRESLRLEAIDPLIINIRTFSGIADAGAVWILLYAMRTKSSYIVSGAIFGFVIFLTYFTIGKRLVLAWPILSVALGYHFYVRRITLSVAPWAIGGILILGLMSLFFRIFLPASVANVSIDLRGVSWAQGSLIKFYLYSLEFSTFEMITLSIFESARIISAFGDAFNAFIVTNIIPFFYAVPRMLWSGKPEIFLDLSHGVNSVISGVPLGQTTVGVAATLIGNAWIIGGFPGLTFAMFIYGWLCGRLDKPLRHKATISATNIIFLSFSLNVVIHAFRQGTLGWIFIITVVQQYGMIIGYAIIVVVAGTEASRKTAHRFAGARTQTSGRQK